MAKADLTYSSDGMWTRFYPETPQGEEAWNVMAEAMPDNNPVFLPAQMPSVLSQLKAAGYVVRKARPHKPLSADELDAFLAELES